MVRASVPEAGKIVVLESVTDPLVYYLINTTKTRSLLGSAMHGKVEHFILFLDSCGPCRIGERLDR
jgi:UDP-glucose 4-epimerase